MLAALAGRFFKTKIRFNANDRKQAYATVAGLPMDLFIEARPFDDAWPHVDVQSEVTSLPGPRLLQESSCMRVVQVLPKVPGSAYNTSLQRVAVYKWQGHEAQNRALEGDEVALRVCAPEQWVHMKGGALPRSADFSPAPTVQFMCGTQTNWLLWP